MTKGLLFLISTGISWVLVGVIVGWIGRHGYRTLVYQCISGLLHIAATLLVWAFSPSTVLPPAGIPVSTWLIISLSCIGNGFINYFVVYFMGEGMKRGPNSIVWAIVQSGLIFPFLMGSIFFHVPMSIPRLLGIGMIIASIFLYATQKASSAPTKAVSSSRSWILFSLLGFLCCGSNQCCGNLPSYLEHGQAFPSFFRTIGATLGTLLAVTLHLVYDAHRGAPFRLKPGELRGVSLFTLGTFLLGYAVSVFLFFPGLDLLQAAGRGSMGYPIVVCSCIVGFFLYGLLALHEKLRPLQLLGAILGIAGILIGIL